MVPIVLTGFGVAALIDWIAVARQAKRTEYVAKPAATGLLVVLALTVDADVGSQRWWFVAALVASLLGDVFLMLAPPRFVSGLRAFLVAHLCYIAGFWVAGASGGARLVALFALGLIGAASAVPLVRGMTRTARTFLVPVVAYMVVITAMVASAFASTILVAALGAALFWISDYLIAWNRFVRSLPWAPVAIMVTYHLGQVGLVLSLPASLV